MMLDIDSRSKKVLYWKWMELVDQFQSILFLSEWHYLLGIVSEGQLPAKVDLYYL